MRSWVDPTFQRNQVADQVRQFLGAQLVAIRRHRRAVDEGVLAQGRLLKGPQLFFGIEELHGEEVVIEEPAGDLGALARDDAEEPWFGRTAAPGSTIDRSRSAARRCPPTSVRSGPVLRPLPADAMAARAAALAFENRLAPCRLARRGRAPRLGGDGAEVRDDVAGVDF